VYNTRDGEVFKATRMYSMNRTFVENTQATVKMDNWLVKHCVACVKFFEIPNQLFKCNEIF
jgi:hypothetical protein